MVTADFPPDVGGIQTYAFELARRLAARAEAFELVAPRRPDSARIDRRLPFRVRRVPALPDGLALSGIASAAYLASRMRPEAVFAAHWSCAHALLSSRRRTVHPLRIGAALHGRELISKPLAAWPLAQRAYDAIRRRALAGADVLFPVSNYTASLLAPFNVQKVVVANNGVDAERFRPNASWGAAFRAEHRLGNGLLLLTLGRLVARKGIDTVLEAMPALLAEFPDLAYAVAGAGPDRARLESLVQQRGLSRHVRFLGALPEDALARAHNAADVFVMPARSDGADVEGFGLVFLEASSCEKPVIGARSGGVPDAIVDGETGYLVDPGSPTELGDRLRTLLASAEHRARLGAQGRARVLARGTWDHCADTIWTALTHS